MVNICRSYSNVKEYGFQLVESVHNKSFVWRENVVMCLSDTIYGDQHGKKGFPCKGNVMLMCYFDVGALAKTCHL